MKRFTSFRAHVNHQHQKNNQFYFRKQHKKSILSSHPRYYYANPQNKRRKLPFFERLNIAWKNTEINYYPIPVGIGIAFIAFQTLRHKYEEHEANKKQQRRKQDQDNTIDRPIVGPWQIHVLDTLPLRALSRLWGKLNNEYTLPIWLREPFYRLYSWLFNCNLDEIENPDLKSYPNLGSFFYRSLKPDVRPIEDEFLVSPADGKIVTFGIITEGRIEQVKGVTYSLDSFLGHKTITNNTITDEKEFANVNGITYSLDSLLGDDDSIKKESNIRGVEGGLIKSIKYNNENNELKNIENNENGNNYKETFETKEQIVAKNVTLDQIGAIHRHQVKEGNALFFYVVYLAPGDYHRFHSPTNWVIESRRHFAGELYSVSPYMIKLLPNLFVLNERVALLGRWKYGFFAMVPVGATNALRTNRKENIPIGTFTEASYKNSSKLLSGHPLRVGDEMGGFYLGSTIVLVFEAPLDFKFYIKPGQKIKYEIMIAEVKVILAVRDICDVYIYFPTYRYH
ncbi:4088_t:CDS:2 [Diversispora eburnea]|uniref:Phosphatidylserine decarboxylase proenzyme 1, mitochondrial n=1 Tax=Diversispora eburnea TaxID=1213867 RepID=A0A9N8ZSR1_9GLOM|nr:4088_t:CDS:2 [Diversispora eburnea]